MDVSFKSIKRSINRSLARHTGYTIEKSRADLPSADSANSFHESVPYPDFKPQWREVISKVKDYTMTPAPRIYNLCLAVEYIVKHQIAGSLVECGVWKGGSVMAMALVLQKLGIENRDLYLYDTFEGMTRPEERDRFIETGQTAEQRYQDVRSEEKDIKYWAYSTLDEVQKNISSTSYPENRIKYIKGPVEDTLPGQIPDKISLLRLDTDWYASTKHELLHLYPRLQEGGIIMIDDYGTFSGAAEATDEYFMEIGEKILLVRADDCGMYMGVKPAF